MGLYHSWKRAGSPGKITRLLSCEQDQLKSTLRMDETPASAAEQNIPYGIVRGESIRINPSQNDTQSTSTVCQLPSGRPPTKEGTRCAGYKWLDLMPTHVHPPMNQHHPGDWCDRMGLWAEG